MCSGTRCCLKSEIDSWLSKYRFKRKSNLDSSSILRPLSIGYFWQLVRAFAKQKEASFRIIDEGVTEGQQESRVLLRDLCSKRQTINP